MKKFEGNLIINSISELGEYKDLEEVTGDLHIDAQGAQLPVLQSVGEDLEIRYTDAFLPLLEKIKGQEVASQELIKFRLKEVAKHALKEPDSLIMDKWHSCETSHCLAGWACHLFGKDLEKEVGHTGTAGAILIGIDSAKQFHNYDADQVREWLRSVA